MAVDVVSRLRAEARPKGGPANYRDELFHEAADEIERLRAALSGAKIMASTRALQEFDGEPWLERIRAIEL